MILGAHESAAGGLARVFERCSRDRADAVQLWTRSSRQWAAKPLDPATIEAFRKAHAERAMPLAAHASYLINLAAPAGPIYERSTKTLLEECQRAELLGIGQVIVHPGAHQGLGSSAGVRRVAGALREICRTLGTAPRVRLLLELTAGQGSCVGCSFAELATILDQTGESRLGICLDTQHMFAAGIDWTTARTYDATWDAFDHTIGLGYLEAFHLNDSKRPLGSRVDRHAILGEGLIGLEPFRRLINDPRFARIPGYLETPPLPNGEDSYGLCLKRLRKLLEKTKSRRESPILAEPG